MRQRRAWSEPCGVQASRCTALSEKTVRGRWCAGGGDVDTEVPHDNFTNGFFYSVRDVNRCSTSETAARVRLKTAGMWFRVKIVWQGDNERTSGKRAITASRIESVRARREKESARDHSEDTRIS